MILSLQVVAVKLQFQHYGAIQVGTLMAGTDKFFIRVNGVGGHGGTPHLVKDTVVAASAVVMNLQPLVSRETDPAEGGIVGVTLINSGKLILLMVSWCPLFMLDSTSIANQVACSFAMQPYLPECDGNSEWVGNSKSKQSSC